MWDSDTLLQERSRFPDTLELITGKFLRHSSDFYQWRIRDRIQKLESDPYNPVYYDDLAVAYDKTGRHQKAIETMRDKESRCPGLYETAANLGTFYIHDGRLEEGLEYIDRALRINPDAHFGREKYQRLLVEYLLSRRRDGVTPLPLGGSEPHATFTGFLSKKEKTNALDASEREAAVKGVLGMMRFGNHASPVLLEALADLLASRGGGQDAKRLAARAYLKASDEVSDEWAKRAYREKARSALTMQTKSPLTPFSQLPLEELEASFRQELAEADAWYAKVRQDELDWIQQGKDPEAEFVRKYYAEPSVATHWREGVWAMVEANRTVAVMTALAAVLVPMWLIRRWMRRRRMARATA
jgi:tetratricopeptide (TPR) repeat protein